MNKDLKSLFDLIEEIIQRGVRRAKKNPGVALIYLRMAYTGVETLMKGFQTQQIDVTPEIENRLSVLAVDIQALLDQLEAHQGPRGLI